MLSRWEIDLCEILLQMFYQQQENRPAQSLTRTVYTARNELGSLSQHTTVDKRVFQVTC